MSFTISPSCTELFLLLRIAFSLRRGRAAALEIGVEFLRSMSGKSAAGAGSGSRLFTFGLARRSSSGGNLSTTLERTPPPQVGHVEIEDVFHALGSIHAPSLYNLAENFHVEAVELGFFINHISRYETKVTSCED